MSKHFFSPEKKKFIIHKHSVLPINLGENRQKRRKKSMNVFCVCVWCDQSQRQQSLCVCDGVTVNIDKENLNLDWKNNPEKFHSLHSNIVQYWFIHSLVVVVGRIINNVFSFFFGPNQMNVGSEERSKKGSFSEFGYWVFSVVVVRGYYYYWFENLVIQGYLFIYWILVH